MKRWLSTVLCVSLLMPYPAVASAAARALQAPHSPVTLSLSLPPSAALAAPDVAAAPQAPEIAQAFAAPAAQTALTAFGAEAAQAAQAPSSEALPFAAFDGAKNPSATAVAASPARTAWAALAGAAVALHATAAHAIVPHAHAVSQPLTTGDKLGLAALVGIAFGLLFFVRWLSGSDRVQVRMEKQKWKAQTGKKWEEADEETRAVVERNGKAVAAANRAGRVNSWPQLKEELAKFGSAFLIWRWPRYIREMRAEAATTPGPRAVDEETGEEGPYAKRENAKEKVKDALKDLKARIEAAGMTEEAKEAALDELGKLEHTPKQHPDYGNKLAYIEWLLAMPWRTRTTDRIDLEDARNTLDADHYGLEDVKERVLEYLAVRKRTGTLRGPILCFVGPPGVGKTSIAADIARTLGRKFVRLSLGGVEDESEIRGHRRTYLGAEPGAIVARMKRAGTKNPVFLLDEVDKTSSGGRNGRGSGPQNALLELLDPEQNDTFRDRYLDVGFDMSEVLFIVTANDINGIPEPLRDRVEIIQYKSYTTPEKIEIAKRHALPEKQAANGLAGEKIEVTDGAIRAVIEGYTQEAGVRLLRQKLDALMRKIAARAERKTEPVPSLVDAADVEKYLGVPPVRTGRTVDNSVGVASGLYYSPVGGGVTNAVVNVFPGNGTVVDREQMGKQMRDSVDNVLAYVRQHAASLSIDPFLFKKIDISVSFTPWSEIDGPSAGITMTTALVSRLTGRGIQRGVAMTGELSPDGRVLPIGGLNEKVLGALRLGYKTVLYPAENARDAALIDESVRQKIRLVPVERIGQVLEESLEKDVTEPLPDMTPPQAKP